MCVGLSTTRAGESANRLQTGSEVRFESADPAVRYVNIGILSIGLLAPPEAT